MAAYWMQRHAAPPFSTAEPLSRPRHDPFKPAAASRTVTRHPQQLHLGTTLSWDCLQRAAPLSYSPPTYGSVYSCLRSRKGKQEQRILVQKDESFFAKERVFYLIMDNKTTASWRMFWGMDHSVD